MGERGDSPREALIRYLRTIFPAQPVAALGNVADHQIAYLKAEGYRITPLPRIVDAASKEV